MKGRRWRRWASPSGLAGAIGIVAVLVVHTRLSDWERRLEIRADALTAPKEGVQIVEFHRPPEVELAIHVEEAAFARVAAAEGDLLTYRDRVREFSVGLVLNDLDLEKRRVEVVLVDWLVYDERPHEHCGRAILTPGTTGVVRCGGVDVEIAANSLDQPWRCAESGNLEPGENCQVSCGSTTARGPRVDLGCATCCAR